MLESYISRQRVEILQDPPNLIERFGSRFHSHVNMGSRKKGSRGYGDLFCRCDNFFTPNRARTEKLKCRHPTAISMRTKCSTVRQKMGQQMRMPSSTGRVDYEAMTFGYGVNASQSLVSRLIKRASTISNIGRYLCRSGACHPYPDKPRGVAVVFPQE